MIYNSRIATNRHRRSPLGCKSAASSCRLPFVERFEPQRDYCILVPAPGQASNAVVANPDMNDAFKSQKKAVSRLDRASLSGKTNRPLFVQKAMQKYKRSMRQIVSPRSQMPDCLMTTVLAELRVLVWMPMPSATMMWL